MNAGYLTLHNGYKEVINKEISKKCKIVVRVVVKEKRHGRPDVLRNPMVHSFAKQIIHPPYLYAHAYLCKYVCLLVSMHT